jgi:prefoldin subunit 5
MLWKILTPIVSTALLGWGAWATVQVTDSTARETFDRHVEEAQKARDKINDRIDRNQQRIVDKLDKIQEYLMDHE